MSKFLDQNSTVLTLGHRLQGLLREEPEPESGDKVSKIVSTIYGH